MHKFYYILVVLLFSYNTNILAQGQANILVDSTNFLIGDPLNLQVVVNIPQGNKIDFPNIASILEKEDLEIIDVSQQEIIPGQTNTTFKQRIKITAWEPKIYEIPALVFSYETRGKPQEIKSTALMLTAKAPKVTGDSTFVADIKPILVEEATLWDRIVGFFTHPVVVAVLLLALLGVIIFLIIQYQQKQALANQRPPSPEEVALRRLEELELNNPLKEGDFKAYHTQISFILRAYINGRFELKALEQPIAYFLPKLSKHEYMTSSLYNELEVVLEHADLIKFAKASPLSLANEKALDLSYKLVNWVQKKMKLETEMEVVKQ